VQPAEAGGRHAVEEGRGFWRSGRATATDRQRPEAGGCGRRVARVESRGRREAYRWVLTIVAGSGSI
jgi:hypothetical protein